MGWEGIRGLRLAMARGRWWRRERACREAGGTRCVRMLMIRIEVFRAPSLFSSSQDRSRLFDDSWAPFSLFSDIARTHKAASPRCRSI